MQADEEESADKSPTPVLWEWAPNWLLVVLIGLVLALILVFAPYADQVVQILRRPS